jgi:cell wall-associated NlpC family hydrolase
MKWILPLITASSVVSGATLATDPQLNIVEPNDSVMYIFAEPQHHTIEEANFAEWVEGVRAEQELRKEQEARLEEAQKQARLDLIEANRQRVIDMENYRELVEALQETRSYVDKTWYVFSGSTPQGWDCSGLVRWTYLQVGLELPHSATDQLYSGQLVDEPRLGDIVTFSFNGSTAGHAGIYLSEDTMIHSGGKRGDKTEIKSISEFGKPYSKIFYTRIIKSTFDTKPLDKSANFW